LARSRRNRAARPPPTPRAASPLAPPPRPPRPQVEGTCSGQHGYIVCVTTVTHVSQGKIRADGSGLATFKVRFGCVTFRPFKGEVLDCIVTSVNKVWGPARGGPLGGRRAQRRQGW
jgi:hypothetical protein